MVLGIDIQALTDENRHAWYVKISFPCFAKELGRAIHGPIPV